MNLEIKIPVLRGLKKNETFKKAGPSIQYYDEFSRNTYYYNKLSGLIVEKEWITLDNGEHREVKVVNNQGFWRIHIYENSILVKELDVYGNTNLVKRRKHWHNDDKLSLETLNKKRKGNQLF